MRWVSWVRFASTSDQWPVTGEVGGLGARVTAGGAPAVVVGYGRRAVRVAGVPPGAEGMASRGWAESLYNASRIAIELRKSREDRAKPGHVPLRRHGPSQEITYPAFELAGCKWNGWWSAGHGQISGRLSTDSRTKPTRLIAA